MAIATAPPPVTRGSTKEAASSLKLVTPAATTPPSTRALSDAASPIAASSPKKTASHWILPPNSWRSRRSSRRRSRRRISAIAAPRCRIAGPSIVGLVPMPRIICRSAGFQTWSGFGFRRWVLRSHEAIPHPIGHQAAHAHHHPGRGGDLVAGAGATGCDRLRDGLRDRLRACAEARHAALVGLGRHLGDVGVELHVGAMFVDLIEAPGGGFAELGDDQAGLDHDDVDAEFLDLEAERVRERFNGVLGGVVDPATGEGELAAHRAQVDDLPGAGSSHTREDELAHPHQAEDVRLELPADAVHRDRLNRPALAVAGVVDQGTDGAVLLDLGDGVLHRVLVA